MNAFSHNFTLSFTVIRQNLYNKNHKMIANLWRLLFFVLKAKC